MNNDTLQNTYQNCKNRLFTIATKPIFRIKTIKTLWDSIHDDSLLPWWCRGRYERIENILKFKRMCVDSFICNAILWIGCLACLILTPSHIVRNFSLYSVYTYLWLIGYVMYFFAVRMIPKDMAEKYNELVFKRKTDKWLLMTRLRAGEFSQKEYNRIVATDRFRYGYLKDDPTHALSLACFNPLTVEEWVNPDWIESQKEYEESIALRNHQSSH